MVYHLSDPRLGFLGRDIVVESFFRSLDDHKVWIFGLAVKSVTGSQSRHLEVGVGRTYIRPKIRWMLWKHSDQAVALGN